MTTERWIVDVLTALVGWLWANGPLLFPLSLAVAALVVLARVAYLVVLALVDLRLRWRAGAALGRGGLAEQLAHGPGQHSAFYTTYLQSGAWRERRARTLMLAGGACQHCGARATDAHHETYDRLGAELDTDLTALCSACHDEIHTRRRRAVA